MKTIETKAVLNDGVEIPYLGLGTWELRGKACERAVAFALKHGYAMIDTAQGYENEHQVGNGWKASGKKREDIFITTKITNRNQGFESSRRSFEKSLSALQTDFVDLLLIHWPEIRDFSRSIETWRAMIELQKEGRSRSIGVSNFTIPLIQQIIDETGVVPAVNQVEFHVFLYQKELLDFCRENHILIEAYSPIARGKFFENETLQKIAEKHEKTVAQVLLAWCVNHGLVVIPKSEHEGRIQENADIFFDLNDDEMQTLNGLGPEIRLVNGPWAPPSW